MKISAHMLIKNEDRFVWYSIFSVINYIDELFIWDTGSSDKTIQIIQKILRDDKYKNIIHFKSVKIQSFKEDELRQKMLEEDKDSNWIVFVDGDEIWWKDSINKIVRTIKTYGNNLDCIVVPTINLVGDIFHYQEEAAGRYQLLGKKGHYNVRAINRKIPGLHGVGEYGIFAWRDLDNKRIQERETNKIKYVEAPYIHATHLIRSSIKDKVYKRPFKYKYEIGNSFPDDFYYPEVLFELRPNIVSSVWDSSGVTYKIISALVTPIKKLRRRFFMKGVRYGY